MGLLLEAIGLLLLLGLLAAMWMLAAIVVAVALVCMGVRALVRHVRWRLGMRRRARGLVVERYPRAVVGAPPARPRRRAR
jgi:hypothetical protein